LLLYTILYCIALCFHYCTCTMLTYCSVAVWQPVIKFNLIWLICLLAVFLANQACFAARLSLTSSFCKKTSVPANHAALSPVEQCRSDNSYKKLCDRRRTARRVFSQNILYNRSTTNRSNGVSGLQLVATIRRLSYRCRQQASASMSSVDNAIDLSWGNFLSPEFGENSEGKYRNFGGYPLFSLFPAA